MTIFFNYIMLIDAVTLMLLILYKLMTNFLIFKNVGHFLDTLTKIGEITKKIK